MAVILFSALVLVLVLVLAQVERWCSEQEEGTPGTSSLAGDTHTQAKTALRVLSTKSCNYSCASSESVLIILEYQDTDLPRF